MIEKLPSTGVMNCDFHAKVNEIIEAMNHTSGVLDGLKNGIVTDIECEGWGSITVSRASWNGFRPLHIEDGQVKEESAFSVIQGEVVPPKGGYNTSRCEHSYVTINNGAHLWERCNNCGQCINMRRPSCTCSHLYGGISHNASCPLHSRTASVPEAEPRETIRAYQETMIPPAWTQPPPESQQQERERSFGDALAHYCQLIRQDEVCRWGHGAPTGLKERLTEARAELYAAAHREYAQPDTKGCEHPTVRPFYQPRLDAGPTIFLECPDCGVRLPLSKSQYAQYAQPANVGVSGLTTVGGSTVTLQTRDGKYYYAGTDVEFPGENHGL